MRWLTTDRIRCLDCRTAADVPSRWLRDVGRVRCPRCGSPAVERCTTPLRLLRDVFIISNAA